MISIDKDAIFLYLLQAECNTLRTLLLVLLTGTLFLLTVTLMYAAWSHCVFRGKVRGEIGSH